MLVPDLYVFTLKFLAYKKRTKHEKINFLPRYFLCNFSVRTLQCFQNKIFFFGPQKVKKNCPQKLLIIRLKLFFHVLGRLTKPNMSQDASVLLSVSYGK